MSADELPLPLPAGPGAVGAVVGVVGAAAVAAGAWAGALPLAIVLIALGVVVSFGAPRLLNLPHPTGSTRTLLLGTTCVAVVELLADRAGNLRWLGTALAIGLMISFLAEMLRRDGRPRLTESIAGTALVLAILATGAFYLPTLIEFRGAYATGAACAGVAIGLLADLLAHARTSAHEWSLPVGLLVSAVAGWGIGIGSDRPWNISMLTALVACGVSYALRIVLRRAAHPTEQAALGAASVLVAGIAPYALLWVFAR
ncbi:hypothetical protein [Calidifontibacter terrae]